MNINDSKEYKTELEDYRKLIKSVIKEYIGKSRRIDWNYAPLFFNELQGILDKVSNLENKLLLIDVLLMLLVEGSSLNSRVKDPEGLIEAFIQDILYMMEEIISDLSNSDDEIVKNKVFDKILEVSDNKVFNKMKFYKRDLYDVCCKLAYTDELREKLKLKITQSIKKSYCDEYVIELLELIYKIIEMYGSDEEVEQFLYDHIEEGDFLEILIEKYIERADFKGALDLIYKLEQDKKFKLEMCSPDELRYKVNTASEENKKQCELEKKKLKETLEHVKECPSDIEKFMDILEPKYKDEVIEIYEAFIKQLAEQASNRAKYSMVCSKINIYKDLAGNDKKNKIVDEFKILYKKKRAFMDELSKIK